MRVAVILNGVSRKKALFYRHVYPGLARAAEVEVWETRGPGHATELARQAAEQAFEVVLAAGGDGTLHQVLNGLHTATLPPPILGVVPLGTGNDFARLMHARLRAVDWAQCLQAPPQRVDIGQIRFGEGLNETRYFINACSVGLGPEVVHRLAASNRAMGPFITYFLAIAQTFLSHRPQPLTLTTDRAIWSGNMRVAAVANGQSFGNQIYVAPNASVVDGCFNIFVAGQVTLTDFLRYLTRLKNKKEVRDPRLHYSMATFVRLESSEPLWLEAEGELVGQLPAEITVLPAAQRFLNVIGLPEKSA